MTAGRGAEGEAEKRRSGEGQVKKTANIKNMTTMWQHEAAML